MQLSLLFLSDDYSSSFEIPFDLIEINARARPDFGSGYGRNEFTSRARPAVIPSPARPETFCPTCVCSCDEKEKQKEIVSEDEIESREETEDGGDGLIGTGNKKKHDKQLLLFIFLTLILLYQIKMFFNACDCIHSIALMINMKCLFQR